MLSREAWELIRDESAGDPVGEGLVRLRQTRAIEPRPLVAAMGQAEVGPWLQSLIPAAIRTRIDAGQTEWLGEHRLARWSLKKALRQAEVLNLPYEQALIHLEAARGLTRNHPDRTTRIDRAAAILQKISSVPLVGDPASLH